MARTTKSGRGNHGSQTTTDHEQIRQWAEERGGKPACVRGTGGRGDTGLLRIDFPGYSGGKSLAPISWDEFFEKFDEQGLALLYQEETAGGERSNFNKLVSRETAAANDRKSSGRSGGSNRGGSARGGSSRGGSSRSGSNRGGGSSRKSASSSRASSGSRGGSSGGGSSARRAGGSSRSSGGSTRTRSAAKRSPTHGRNAK